ncbi:response regulator transcription factor [Chloroflexi bacterium TSY]|nr:response regulator transcription factor [Chloroflexi bacterium TSY]
MTTKTVEQTQNIIQVMLVDDHHVVRRGLRSFLESFSDIRIIGEAANGEEALAKIGRWVPDVAVVDLLMPGGIDGIETTSYIHSRSPHTKIVVLTAYTDDARVVAALREGAIGYVRKDAEPSVLLSAVRGAARGQSVLDPNIAGTVLEELAHTGDAIDSLTAREMEVLQQLACGSTNREIADALVIGEETVKTHIGNILSKLQLAHRTQAVVYALKRGLISLDELEI